MLRNRRLLVSFLVALVVVTPNSAVVFKHYFALADEEQASIESASSAISQAFSSVLDAEKAGGNVSQLLAQLNEAGSLLAEAENAYRTGNLTLVGARATAAEKLAERVRSDAVKLRDTSVVESENEFWLTLTFSVTGAILFIVALLLVWRRYKRAHMQRVLDMKPEVVTDKT